ncbi:MAG TPA: redoxin domain-containing protein [Flavobacterium sp.]
MGTTFDDFTVKGYRTKKVNLYHQKKPLLVVTYATWCLINKGETPALNKIAKDYKDKIDIIVLFWNKKNDIKKIAAEFTKDVRVCYANENYNDDFRIIATIKHTLGLPICFLIDENKQLVYMRRIASKKINLRTDPNATITNHYMNFKKDIDYYILKKDTTYVSGL